MGLNDIKLSPHLAAALYGKSLVEETPMITRVLSDDGKIVTETITYIAREEDPGPISPPIKKSKTKETGNLKSLGGNQKNILIVVNYDNVVHIPDEELEFLTNILKACHFSLDDVTIVNTNNFPGEGFRDYVKKFGSRIILLFGVDPVSFDLPVSFPEFQVQSFNSNTFLYSPTLQECRTDKLLKSKLWVCLQRIFGL
jgi:hypothetical protein